MRIIWIMVAFISWHVTALGADLIEVYQQAQLSDPIFQQAVSQRLATKEGVPISAAALLPNLSVNYNPAITRYGYAGSNYETVAIVTPGAFISPRNLTQRTYTLNLLVTQTVFNFSQFANLAGQVALSKSADATLNAALQDLMVRVANTYFAVLNDEDNLTYSEASKRAYAEQLHQEREQYKVGLKTLTDVYTAQASYELSTANVIAAETKLANDRENLRAITGIYYEKLAPLSENFPLITPQPANMETWVQAALHQNWSIKAAQYNVNAARQTIRQQAGGHLPTIQAQGLLQRQYMNNINGYTTLNQRNGPGTISERQLAFNINVPLFSGGGVTAQTNQAAYNFQIAQQQLEQTVRNTLNTARQSYMNIIASMSKLEADRQAVKSSISSEAGLTASYQVGIGTLVDVLNQQQRVYQSQTQYASDRYAYINNLFLLKQAAGTLSFNDLHAINSWLGHSEQVHKKHKNNVNKLKS